MEGDGVISAFVARAEQERYPSAPGSAGQRRNRYRLTVELLAVAPYEFAPTLRLMPEPSTQRHARSDVLQPEID